MSKFKIVLISLISVFTLAFAGTCAYVFIPDVKEFVNSVFTTSSSNAKGEDNTTDVSTDTDNTGTVEVDNGVLTSIIDRTVTTLSAEDLAGVTSIGDYAFYNCTSLTSIEIPTTVTEIGDYAFSGCTNLETVTFEGSNSGISTQSIETQTPSLTSIGKYAFYGCTNLIAFTFPESITTIDSNAFYNCKSLENLDISSCTNLTSIGSHAFQDCSLIADIDFSNLTSLESIGSYAFYGCGLTSIDLTDCVKLVSINSCAFYNMSLSSFKLPNCIEYLGESVISNSSTILSKCCSIDSDTGFYYLGNDENPYLVLCDDSSSSATSFKLRSETKIIFSYAFKNNTALLNLDLSDATNLIEIGYGAFYGCSSLVSVISTPSIKYIDGYAFYNCTSLATFDFTNLTNLTTIGYYAFYYCKVLSNLDFTNLTNLTSIGFYAFRNCSLITDLDLSNCLNLTTIDYYAFYGCTGIQSVVIPNSVTYIGEYIFYDCSSITNITLPFVGQSRDVPTETYSGVLGYIFGGNVSGMTSVKQYYCSSSTVSYIPSVLTSVTITDDSDLYYGAFSNITTLTDVTIYGIESIPTRCFYGCTNLENVNLVDSTGLTVIDNSAFYNCTSLTTFDFTNLTNLTTISSYAFCDCTSLATFDFTNLTNLTTISSSAFSNCTSLTDIDISQCENLTTINSYAFYNCNGVESLDLSKCENLTTISSCAFYNWTNLTTVTIPNNVTSIGDSSFSGCSSLTSMTLPFIGNPSSSSYASGLFGYIFGSDSSTGTAVIQYYANSSSNKLTYYIPTNLTSVTVNGGTLHYGAFYGCTMLTDITLNNVDAINSCAFCGCTGLTSIVVPNSVTSIGSGAFSGCSSLTNMTLPFVGNTSSSTDASGLFGYIFGSNSSTGTAVVQYYASSNKSTTNYIPTSLTSVTITGGSLSYGAFYGCSMLTTILLEGVDSIGCCAFAGCTGLTTLWIPDTVTTISSNYYYTYSPFYDCSSDLEIYCEAEESQSAWGEYWNYCALDSELSTYYNYSYSDYLKVLLSKTITTE